MKKMWESVRHHLENIALFSVGLLAFLGVGKLATGMLNDQKAPLDLGTFQYIPLGVIILCAGIGVIWIVFNLLFPTINKWIDKGGFVICWTQCEPDTRVKVTVYGALALLFIAVYAFHP